MAKKRRYIVVPRTEDVQQTGITAGNGRLNFGDKSAAWVDDPAIAREIDTTHGLKGSGDVWVAQDENLEWHERHDGMTDGKNLGVHHYTFARMGISLPSRKSLIGKKKIINDVAYMYIMRDDKLRLEPYEKRRKRASKREVTSAEIAESIKAVDAEVAKYVRSLGADMGAAIDKLASDQ